jgi:hypothetical protein
VSLDEGDRARREPELGFADFLGPLKGRTFGALRVLVYVQLGGLVTIAIIVAIRGKAPTMLRCYLQSQPHSPERSACTRTTAGWPSAR